MKRIKFINGPISEDFLDSEKTQSDNYHSGAVTSFTGKVRSDKHDQKKVVAIEFTAHEEIAVKTSEEIISKIHSEFDINKIRILHSLKRVEAGEACFHVEVSAAHRKAAFEALPEVVNEVKKACPIFGKEILEDGSYIWKKNRS